MMDSADVNPEPDEADAKVDIAWDARAELAFASGDAEFLALYLCLPQKPSSSVLELIHNAMSPGVHGPRGLDGWFLSLSPRNGRPPKNMRSEAFRLANRLKVPDPSRTTVRKLATMLKPDGKSKWRLKFKRKRRGNPRSKIETSLRLSILGHEERDLRARGVSSEEIYRQLPASRRLIQKSIQHVKTVATKKPTD